MSDFDAEVKADMARDKVAAGTESAHCALINFDNVVKMNPGLGNHPIFRMARGQLVDALHLLGREDAA
jgi:hypothetical protein